MAIDTPARIAILGAGPIGIEAALYARFLGYDVEVYERGRVAEHVRRWGHVRLFTPWRMNCTPLGIAALRAQDSAWQVPPADECPTGHELIARYLLPLAATDLVIDSLRERTTVVAVGKQSLRHGELAGDVTRGDEPFRLLLRSADGAETTAEADAVIDATGTFGQHNDTGAGRIAAPGERDAADRIEYGLPDVIGMERDRYAGARVLVLGAGHSAATTIVALGSLEPRPNVIWITRREPLATAGPIDRIADDPLAERDRAVRAANWYAANLDPHIRHLPGTAIAGIQRDEAETLRIKLAGMHEETVTVDRVIANVGYRPDSSIARELHVEFNGVTDGLDDPSGGPAALVNGEPNFYVLGAKSFGRNSRFLLTDGHRQIRDLFTILGDRPTLDLYATMPAI
ncbi:MAG TPA: hypothetical protein VHZ24_18795 [Pirellulales bacterium]|jgi:thioredoxin reductase|nr:hypothetical protein [Pirellulales bacterium]